MARVCSSLLIEEFVSTVYLSLSQGLNVNTRYGETLPAKDVSKCLMPDESDNSAQSDRWADATRQDYINQKPFEDEQKGRK